MKQFKLVPSGCQGWHTGVLGAGGGRFAYCSTLAIYVYDAETFTLQKLLTGHDRAITGLTWNPQEPLIFATCSLDATAIVWNASTGVRVKTRALEVLPHGLDWNPHIATEVAWFDESGGVHLWHIDDNKTSRITETSTKEGHKIRVMRWNVRRPGVIACGHADGSLSIVQPEARGSQRLQRVPGGKEHSVPVVDLRWDMLSPLYLLCGYKNGDVSLWDMEACAELNVFDRQGAGLRAIGWLEWAPGNFATVNNRTGVIRVWNVSQRHPLELVRATRTGFQAVAFIPGEQQALCAFTDGSVGVFHLGQKQMQYRGLPGHTETIFDVRYCPSNKDVIATASYDSTIKIWHTPTMECQMTLTGQEGVIYGISWSPDNDRLVSASSKSELYVWDTKRGKKVTVMKHHADAIYRVDWNKLRSNRIASSSADGTCVVADPKGEVSRSYRHPRGVYGCHWSPFNPDMLATGCHDAIVRVFDVSQPTTEPVRVLKGHKRRVFNTVWSPLLPNVLASGSDDLTVRVWNISTGRSKVLEGHTHNVRALVWSGELPWVLLSGSWDGTIRLWDTRSKACLRVIRDHHADVYGLDAHPDRPFVFASSSRDTSLRFWILDQTAPQLRIKALLGRPWDEILGDADDFLGDTDREPRLCGPASRKLRERIEALTASGDDVGRLEAIFSFFGDAEGLNDLFSLTRRVVSGVSGAPSEKVQHVDDIVAVYRSRAAEFETVRKRRMGGGIGLVKREDQLRAAAELRLKVGDVEAYCNIMVELGEWLAALAVAPAASVTFWQQLSLKYAEHLADKEDQAAIPHFIAAKAISPLVDFFERRNERQFAVLVSKVHSEGGYSRIPETVSSASGAALAKGGAGGSASTSGAEASARGAGDAGGAVEEKVGEEKADEELSASGASADIVKVTRGTAATLVRDAKIVLAASTLLSINDAAGAVRCLLNGGAVELAYALSGVLKVGPRDFVLRRMAAWCERLGMDHMAAEVLQGCRDTTVLAYLGARQKGTEEEIDRFYTAAGVRPRAAWADSAKSAVKDRKPHEAVRFYVLAGDLAKAAEIGIDLLNGIFATAEWDVPLAEQVIEPLSSVPIASLGRTERGTLLAYAALIGGLRATWRRHTEVVPGLFRTLRSCITRFELDFPVSRMVLLLHEASYMLAEGQVMPALDLLEKHLHSGAAKSRGRPSDAVAAAAAAAESKIDGAGGESATTPEESLRAAASALLEEARERASEMGDEEEAAAEQRAALLNRPNRVVVEASLLPTGSALLMKTASLVTDAPVNGPSVELSDGSLITVGEAIQWSSVNAFSPDCSGGRLAGY